MASLSAARLPGPTRVVFAGDGQVEEGFGPSTVRKCRDLGAGLAPTQRRFRGNVCRGQFSPKARHSFVRAPRLTGRTRLTGGASLTSQSDPRHAGGLGGCVAS